MRIGARLGAYEVVGKLGEGGMGEVYRARDLRLGRDVALKVLPASFVADADRLARFEREARTLASLNHPGIGAIYGLEHLSPRPGQPEMPALILELVEGDTVDDRLRHGPMPSAAAVGLARQIADALDAAHERGIVHRDLKPSNIKITPDGIVKVLDFGLAKAVAGDGEPSGDVSRSPTVLSGTGTGIVLGTAGYMSPEQARGQRVDKRTDVWAFGCVLYEMLSGLRAFRGETISDVISAVLTREPDWSALPASTPPHVRALLRRCLQKDARQRVRDIADARLALDDDTSAEAAAPPARGRSWLAWTMLGLAMVVAAALGWLAARRQAAPPAPAFDRLVRLVSTAAHEFGPAISPDGKWVAYLSNTRGPTDVWVKFIAGGDPVNLTAASGLTVQTQDNIGGLAVSPDGSEIAFQAQEPRQLSATWVIPAPLGGPPRRLLPAGRSGMQWSADGSRIAYVLTGGSLGDELAIADADGQNEVVLVTRQGGRHIHWVRWDAAGTFVYFNYGAQTGNAERTEIFRAAVSGAAPERVVGTARRAVSACPSPDGTGLYFAANPDGVDLDLWWKDLSTGRQSRITTGVGEYNAPVVSADGRRLVGTVTEVRSSLERIAVSFDRPVAFEPVTDGHSGDVDPSWSPDGSRLVFSSSRGGHRTLWAMSAAFSQLTPVTSGAVLDERAAYSPDGQQIAFISDRRGQRGVWLVSADGGTPRLLATVEALDTLSWAPDGRRLVFSTPVGDTPGLMTLEVDGGMTARVSTPGPATYPAWSPREDVLAYIEPLGGATGAFVKFVTLSGQPAYGRAARDGRAQIGNGFLAWSPDGRRVAGVSLPGAFPGSIWIMDLEAGTDRKLIDLGTTDLIRGISWSRDGSSLIVGRIRRSGDIFLAERTPSP